MAVETKLCGGCGQPVRVSAKACAFCKTSTEGLADEPAVPYTPPPSPDANPSQARMIATPVIVVVAGYVLGLVVGPLLLWLAGSLVLAGAWPPLSGWIPRNWSPSCTTRVRRRTWSSRGRRSSRASEKASSGIRNASSAKVRQRPLRRLRHRLAVRGQRARDRPLPVRHPHRPVLVSRRMVPGS